MSLRGYSWNVNIFGLLFHGLAVGEIKSSFSQKWWMDMLAMFHRLRGVSERLSCRECIVLYSLLNFMLILLVGKI